MRKALVVGIDYYHHIPSLYGCVNDASEVCALLERNEDGSVNFGTRIFTAKDGGTAISRRDLKDYVQELFADDSEVALFYFAGHGHLEATGGYLCASDCKDGDDGLPLIDVITFANASKAKNKIIVLDSCHSGVVGDRPNAKGVTELSEGLTILTASTAEQYATEENGSGTFTTLFVDALGGAAANLVGEITPGAAYAHVDQSLGPWAQRPVFKTNIKKFVSLRRVAPPLPLAELRKIVQFFPAANFEYQLDPSYEPERSKEEEEKFAPPNPAHTKVFETLQKYNRVNLLVPLDAPHMWHAAMGSKKVKLTALGEHYRRLVAKGVI